MTLSAGDRLGPYEILSPIGAGGMGQVWKARDTRLDRVVAVKVSSQQFNERFEREARAVAALNHPHICQLYDVGPNYLVMEYIEGKPLKGPLPHDQAMKYAAQVCDALDAAHKKGIVHRDLKPENILVSRQGIKLLDFGLARMAPGPGDVTLTHVGDRMGTPAYMAPEQWDGKPADSRSDIYAFGCVLHEMLTGKLSAQGRTTLEPAALESVVNTCLKKDPDERWQSARDLQNALELSMAAVAPVRSRWRERAAWIGAIVISGALLLFAGARWDRQPAGGAVRFVINPPENMIFSGALSGTVATPQFALSPDARAIVFSAAAATGRSMLWMRLMDDVAARPLPGTENASDPFWSPDSRSVGFFSDGKLKKIAAEGGPVQLISPVGNPRGASWGPDGTILFASGNTGLSRVAASGGPIVAVTKLDTSRQEGSHRWPLFLPDGRHFIYLIRSGALEYRGIYVGSLDGGTRKFLLPIDSNVFYAPPGYLLYLNDDTFVTQPFDPDRLELSGQPVAVAERVGRASQGYGATSVSRNGVFAYAGPILNIGRLTWFDRSGNNLGPVAPEGDYTSFRLSPDEKQLAAALVNSKTGTADIWLTDIARGSTSRFTFGPSVNASPVWSPDGKRIIFRTVRKGVAEFYEKSSSGGGKEEPVLLEDVQRAVLTESNNAEPTDWSSDGRVLIYSNSTSNVQLWTLPFDPAGGKARPVRFLDSSADLMHGGFSPDGRLVAYTSNESGKFEVKVQTFPASERVWQVSTNGGSEPRWRGDGQEIYYLSEDRKLMAVSVGAGPSFGVPKPLFQTRVAAGVKPLRMSYVPSRDGQRFLVNTQIGDPPPNPITVVLNWTAGLKK